MCSNCGRAGVIHSSESFTSRSMFICSCGNPVLPATPAQLVTALSRTAVAGGTQQQGVSNQVSNGIVVHFQLGCEIAMGYPSTTPGCVSRTRIVAPRIPSVCMALSGGGLAGITHQGVSNRVIYVVQSFVPSVYMALSRGAVAGITQQGGPNQVNYIVPGTVVLFQR